MKKTGKISLLCLLTGAMLFTSLPFANVKAMSAQETPYQTVTEQNLLGEDADGNQAIQLHITFATPYVDEEAQSLNHIQIAESDYEAYATLTEYRNENLDSYNGQVLLTDGFLDTFFTNPSLSNFEGMAHVKLIKTMTPGYMYSTRFNIVRKDHKPISDDFGTSDINVLLNGKVVTATYSKQGIFEKCDSFVIRSDSFIAAKNPNPSDTPDTNPSVAAQTQKITVSKKVAKTVVYKATSLKKKKATFSIGAKAKTKLSYTVSKNAKKNITVSKTGKVTLKKGLKKGTYKITITAAKTAAYKKATKVVTIKVK